MKQYDKIIIGAGMYGLYSALFCAKRGQSVLVLECDSSSFSRATYINQARVHQGYHYPRSLSTAMKSAEYFDRFNKDYDFCINREFDKVYATSKQYSWTDREQFMEFCKSADIPCEELHPERFFKKDMCDGAFPTREYTYDAMILRDYFLDKLLQYNSVEIQYGIDVASVERQTDQYVVRTEGESKNIRQAFYLMWLTPAATKSWRRQVLRSFISNMSYARLFFVMPKKR